MVEIIMLLTRARTGWQLTWPGGCYEAMVPAPQAEPRPERKAIVSSGGIFNIFSGYMG